MSILSAIIVSSFTVIVAPFFYVWPLLIYYYSCSFPTITSDNDVCIFFTITHPSLTILICQCLHCLRHWNSYNMVYLHIRRYCSAYLSVAILMKMVVDESSSLSALWLLGYAWWHFQVYIHRFDYLCYLHDVIVSVSQFEKQILFLFSSSYSFRGYFLLLVLKSKCFYSFGTSGCTHKSTYCCLGGSKMIDC